MKPYQKELLADLINKDEKLADQVFRILNALSTAQICGQAVVTPKTKDCPIVLISYNESLKTMIEDNLKKHGVPAPWEIDEQIDG